MACTQPGSTDTTVAAFGSAVSFPAAAGLRPVASQAARFQLRVTLSAWAVSSCCPSEVNWTE